MYRYGRYLIVTVLCLFSIANSQQCGSAGVTKTISSPTDLAEVAACPTFYGSLALGTGLTGNVTLDGIEILKGDLTCDGANGMIVFETTDLESVEGAIEFSNCQNLEILDFRSYLNNASSVRLTDLPSLTEWWDSYADYGTVLVERTALENVSFYLRNEDFVTSSIILRDNPNLYSVDLSGYDTEMGEFAIINSPRAELSVSGLEKIAGLELRNIRSLYGYQVLLNINGDVIIENTEIGQTLDYLEYVGGNMQLFNTSGKHSEYGHANYIDLTDLQYVGGKLQVYNVWEHTSVALKGWRGSYFSQPDIASVDIAGLIHELPDSIDFGSSGPNTTYINFRSTNGFFDCCKYAYLQKRLDLDFFCAENVTLPSADDYSQWELGAQRPSSIQDSVDIKSCKASADSPKYSDEPSSSSGGNGGGSSIGGSYGGGSADLSPKSKKLIGAIVGPVSAAILGVIFFCCRRHRKQKKKEKEQAIASHAGQANMSQTNAIVVQPNKTESYRQDAAWTHPPYAHGTMQNGDHGSPAFTSPAGGSAGMIGASNYNIQHGNHVSNGTMVTPISGGCSHCQHCQHGHP